MASHPGGWTVPDDLQGWRFRVEPAPGGVIAGGVDRASPTIADSTNVM